MLGEVRRGEGKVEWDKLGEKIKLYSQTEQGFVYPALGARGISLAKTHSISFSLQLHFKSPNYNTSLAYSHLHKAVSRFYSPVWLQRLHQFLLWWSSVFW